MRVIIQLLISLEIGKKERRGRERKRGRKVGVKRERKKGRPVTGYIL